MKNVLKKTIAIKVNFLFVWLFSFSTQASEVLDLVIQKYASASSVQVKIKKIDEKIILGSKSKSEGELKFVKGKLFISLNSDKKIEFFYKDETIWLIEYPDLDFEKNGHRKVTVLTKKTPALLSGILKLFSNKKSFLNEFQILSEKTIEKNLYVEFKPKQKNMKNFSLTIDKEKKEILSIGFIDDVDTKTSLELAELKLGKKVSAKTFDFSQEKTDEVIHE